MGWDFTESIGVKHGEVHDDKSKSISLERFMAFPSQNERAVPFGPKSMFDLRIKC
jgi:hypothetical protein